MKIATRCALLLFALLWLGGCGETKQAPVRTELIEWPVIVYAELPATLTEPLQAPPPPSANCKLPDGTSTPCAFDALIRELSWQQLLQRVNDDRATSGRLGGAKLLAPTSRTAGDAGE